MNVHRISNLAEPVNNSDAVTKLYVDTNVGISQTTADARYYANTVTLDNIETAIDNLTLNNHRIIDLADPVSNTDAVNLRTADSRYIPITTTLNEFNNPTADLSLTGFKLVNLADATLDTDGLNRRTADSRYYANTLPISQM